MMSLLKIGDSFNKNVVSIVGNSTDTKPTTTIDGVTIYNGSTLYEMDTKIAYMFDEEHAQWIAI